jgi:hypothetical protein
MLSRGIKGGVEDYFMALKQRLEAYHVCRRNHAQDQDAMGQNIFNLALHLILEFVALFALGYWGWAQHQGMLRYALAVNLPVIAAVLWATFRVPGEGDEQARDLHGRQTLTQEYPGQDGDLEEHGIVDDCRFRSRKCLTNMPTTCSLLGFSCSRKMLSAATTIAVPLSIRLILTAGRYCRARNMVPWVIV